MMIALKNYYHRRDNILIDRDGRRIGTATEGQPTAGWFAELEGNVIGLFQDRGQAWLWWNEQVFPVTAGRMTQLEKPNCVSILTVTLEERTLQAEYVASPPVSTLFYSEDEEDADFGLWLHRLLCSEERLTLFLKSHGGEAG